MSQLCWCSLTAENLALYIGARVAFLRRVRCALFRQGSRVVSVVSRASHLVLTPAGASITCRGDKGKRACHATVRRVGKRMACGEDVRSVVCYQTWLSAINI